MKQKAIIFDLDGTLFNCDHRRHFVEGEKKDWKNFLHPLNLEQDTINKWCLELIYAMIRFHYTILFVSGRTENLRDITNQSLSKNCYYSPLANLDNHRDLLFMRKDGDYREDSIIKEEIYYEKIKPYYDILFCIDDRKQVVDMWRKLGLTCLQCAEGDF